MIFHDDKDTYYVDHYTILTNGQSLLYRFTMYEIAFDDYQQEFYTNVYDHYTTPANTNDLIRSFENIGPQTKLYVDPITAYHISETRITCKTINPNLDFLQQYIDNILEQPELTFINNQFTRFQNFKKILYMFFNINFYQDIDIDEDDLAEFMNQFNSKINNLYDTIYTEFSTIVDHII